MTPTTLQVISPVFGEKSTQTIKFKLCRDSIYAEITTTLSNYVYIVDQISKQYFLSLTQFGRVSRGWN